MRLFKLYLVTSLVFALFACSDDDEGIEFMFDREISEVSVLTECTPGVHDSTGCFKIRYRYPILTDNYTGLRVWLGSSIVDDTSKSVNDKQVEQAKLYEYSPKFGNFYDTLDLTDTVAQYVKEHDLNSHDSLQVAMFCEYSDGGDPGSVQRVFLHFGDDQPPTDIGKLSDSLWSTGAWFEWSRPTDRTDIYNPGFVSGPIYGYNVVIWASDTSEDIRNLKVMVEGPDGVDYSGNKFYKRQARIRKVQDSIRVDEMVASSGKNKNYLHLVILDGKGYDTEDPENNRFRLTIDGLRTRALSEDNYYTIGISSWDLEGNASGSEVKSVVDKNQMFMTTDSIAPLMPTRLFTVKDSLFPEYTRLDSNNRVAIFWTRSVDPIIFNHGIETGPVLDIPRGCNAGTCYDTTMDRYVIEYYNRQDKSWNRYTYVGDSANYYTKLYEKDDDGNFELSSKGSFITDTIRWVAPGDTLIVRIRSVDRSKYYSAALVDTIYVSPGALAEELKCPNGFVAVSASDSLSFCMERYEHRDAKGKFMTNILHSEAEAACNAVSADGFEVSLCRERDWELVCLSGGSLAYGVIEENDSKASTYLFTDCNVSTNDSLSAADISKRHSNCMNPMGVHDLPGQYQEWVRGRSDDTIAVLKGSSYKIYEGLDRESIAYCTNRAFPFYTRPAYTQDTVYLYREGTKVDTAYAADTLRTLFKKLTKKDFTDTLQFYDVINSEGKVIGTDFSLYSEYKKGGKSWLDSLANGLTYKPTRKEAVFLTGEKLYYRQAGSFYKSSTIGFRCCAYKK
jgi:hypothetical protein